MALQRDVARHRFRGEQGRTNGLYTPSWVSIHIRSETFTRIKVDSVNTFGAPNIVVPQPISARAQCGKLILQREPKSVTVV